MVSGSLGLLSRFDTVVLQDVSPSDNSQIPATATISFYSRGATVKTGTTVGTSPSAIAVYDTGSLQVGNIVQIDNGLQALTIDSVVGTGTVTAHVTTGSVVLAVGSRLVNTSRLVTIYSDPLGTVAVGTSIATVGATGRASGYVRETRYDYLVTGAGLTTRLFVDAEGGFQLSGTAWINALDYASIQAAVDALPADGGVVYIPASRPGEPARPYDTTTTPSYTPPLMLPPNRAVHLLGDGPFATYLRSLDNTKDMIVMGGDYQTIEGMTLLGPFFPPSPNPDTQGRGVVVQRTGPYAIPYQNDTATTVSYRPMLRDCRIEQTSSWGLFISPSPQSSPAKITVWAAFDNVEIRDTAAGGCVRIMEGGSAALAFRDCNFKNYVGYGIKATTQLLSIIDCIIDRPKTAVSAVELTNCSGILVKGVWFELTEGGYAVQLLGTSTGITIVNCLFSRASVAGTLPLAAVEVLGYARGVLIIEPAGIMNLAVGGVGDIHIEESDVPNTHNEVTVIGGSVSVDSATYAPLRVDDQAHVTQLINCASRMRLPRLTTAEIVGGAGQAPLADNHPGDLVFNRDVGRGYLLTNLGWQEMLTV